MLITTLNVAVGGDFLQTGESDRLTSVSRPALFSPHLTEASVAADRSQVSFNIYINDLT